MRARLAALRAQRLESGLLMSTEARGNGTDWALVTLQVKGKLRRFVQASILREDTAALLARRRGECNRCGACCKILLRCPFLGTDAGGQYTCRIYEKRFAQCRLFPLHAADLRELEGQCSFSFEPEPARAAPAAAPTPVPVLE
jgi:hypothetical protein